MLKIIAITTMILLLASCSNSVERPSTTDGGLKPSPCACAEIEDYNGGGYKWQRA